MIKILYDEKEFNIHKILYNVQTEISKKINSYNDNNALDDKEGSEVT